MTSPFLPVFLSNAEFFLTEQQPDIQKRCPGLEEILEFCQQYRRLGIATLLLEADPRAFHTALQKSAFAYLYFSNCAKEATKATGFAMAPFLDAVASGNHDCAQAIARHSRGTWNRDEEYEEDFLYPWFLMNRYYLGATKAQVQAILSRYEEVVGENEDIRLLVCKSLNEGDGKAFARWLKVLIRSWSERYKKLMRSESIPEEEFSTEGQVFVEGLAVLGIADRLGFKTELEYRHIPSLVRNNTSVVNDPDCWKRIHE